MAVLPRGEREGASTAPLGDVGNNTAQQEGFKVKMPARYEVINNGITCPADSGLRSYKDRKRAGETINSIEHLSWHL